LTKLALRDEMPRSTENVKETFVVVFSSGQDDRDEGVAYFLPQVAVKWEEGK
jgi:hypothetical protein